MTVDSHAMSSHDWEVFLGAQVHELRLRAGLRQEGLAEQASVSLSALKKLENGKGVHLITLIKVVRSLGQTQWLSALAPPVSVSPMQMLKSAARRPRQRAPKRPRPPEEM